MKLIDYSEVKREHILAAIMMVALVSAGQFFLMKTLENQASVVTQARKDAAVSRAMLEARTDAVAHYKSTVRIDKNELPSPVESQSKLYSLLINTFSSRGLRKVDIEKASESDGTVFFKVSGIAPYVTLLKAVSSFRQGPYLMKITEFSVSGEKNDAVKFAFTVAARTAPGEEAQKQDEER